MANTATSYPQLSPRSHPKEPSRFRGWRVFGLGIAALAAFQLFGCQAPKSTWEAYQWPDETQETVIRRAANEGGKQQTPAGVRWEIDGSCADCHDGCRDPHPGNRQATCVHCHGGDPSKATKLEAHPTPRFPAEWQSSGNPERPYMLTMQESRDWVQFVNPGDLRIAAAQLLQLGFFGGLVVPLVGTADNSADFLTKPLKADKFLAFRKVLMNIP